MKNGNDFTRQTSLFTMNGLVDPRMLAGYKKTTASASTTVQFNLANAVKRIIVSIAGRMKNQPA